MLLPLARGTCRTARAMLEGLTSLGAVYCAQFTPHASKRLPSTDLLGRGHCMSSQIRVLSTAACHRARENDGRVTVSFTDRDGDVQTLRAKIGDNLLEVAREYDIDLEGACDGTLSCSTCHLVVDPDWFPRITDPITEEEEDMLDLAYGLTDTSRLGCQVVVTEDLDGLKLTIPMATIDARET